VCACVLAQRVDDDVAVVAIVAGAWRVLLGPRMGRSVSTRACVQVLEAWGPSGVAETATVLGKRLCRRATEVVWHLCG
jgi:hypothetical protein